MMRRFFRDAGSVVSVDSKDEQQAIVDELRGRGYFLANDTAEGFFRFLPKGWVQIETTGGVRIALGIKHDDSFIAGTDLRG